MQAGHDKHPRFHPRLTAPLAVLLAAVAGCGGSYDARVSGTVTLDGLPLERGIVAYHPKQGGPVAHGVIQSDGVYVVRTGREAGIPSGEYNVTVVATEVPGRSRQGSGPPPPGRRLTTERVSRKETTPLHYTVEPGRNEIDLNLESQDELPR